MKGYSNIEIFWKVMILFEVGDLSLDILFDHGA